MALHHAEAHDDVARALATDRSRFLSRARLVATYKLGEGDGIRSVLLASIGDGCWFVVRENYYWLASWLVAGVDLV